MNTNKHELKFNRMKRLSRWMIMLPVAAVIMAIVVFILEGFPYPGRSGFSHNIILAEQLTPGLAIFDILYLIMLILFLITLVPLVTLLTDRGLRKIHLAVRFYMLSRFVFYAWAVFFASRLMLSAYHGVLYMPEVLLRNFIFGGLLGAAYFYFKKRYTEKPETMFP